MWHAVCAFSIGFEIEAFRASEEIAVNFRIGVEPQFPPVIAGHPYAVSVSLLVAEIADDYYVNPLFPALRSSQRLFR